MYIQKFTPMQHPQRKADKQRPLKLSPSLKTYFSQNPASSVLGTSQDILCAHRQEMNHHFHGEFEEGEITFPIEIQVINARQT